MMSTSRPKHASHRRAALQLLEALASVGATLTEPALLEAGGLAGLGLERGEQVGGVLRQPGEVVGGAQLADQPGGVPGGAAGQLPALEQHDVGHAAQGEVVGDAAADDAAADDDDACVTGEVGHGSASESARRSVCSRVV